MGDTTVDKATLGITNEDSQVHKDASRRFAWLKDEANIAQVEAFHELNDKRDSHKIEFRQALHEVLNSLAPVLKRNPIYLSGMERTAERQRVIVLLVLFLGDEGVQRANRMYQIQHSSALGPYTSGPRSHPNMNLNVSKFLELEHTFKDVLITLPTGDAKGGSDFGPEGKWGAEVLRFCHGFLASLGRHIGPDVSSTAGDSGAGGRQLGYSLGQLKRTAPSFEPVPKGNDLEWRGGYIMPEVTGCGAEHFAEKVLRDSNQTAEGKICVVIGGGNAAQFVIERLLHLSAIPVTHSDSEGYIYDPTRINKQELNVAFDLKDVMRRRIREHYKIVPGATWVGVKRPWEVDCFAVFLPATQNKIDRSDATILAKNRCKIHAESVDIPSTQEAVDANEANEIICSPLSTATTDGALEIPQNSSRQTCTREGVNERSPAVTKAVHWNIRKRCMSTNVTTYMAQHALPVC